MKADPEYLRRHYASLSDEGLLEIDRDDLIEMAQKYYDAEVEKRGLTGAVEAEEEAWEAEAPGAEPEPDWLESAVEAYSVTVTPSRNQDAENQVATAHQSLEAAGIPTHLEMVELSVDERRPVAATHRWRLMVPANMRPRAVSTLERDLSNPEYEGAYRTHLDSCSDEELRWMRPEVVFCGLFDLVQRVTRAYDEEMSRRGLPPNRVTKV